MVSRRLLSGYKKRAKKSTYKKLTYSKRMNNPKRAYAFKQYGIIGLGALVTNAWNVAGSGSYDNTNGYFAAGATATFSSFAGMFRLADLDQLTNYQNLFDQYKITGVKVKIYPTSNIDSLPAGNVGLVQIAPDYNDITAPTSTGYLRQYGSCKELDGLQGLHRGMYIRPKCVTSLQQIGATVASAGNGRPEWIDTQFANIPHYGVKICVTPNTSQQQYNIVCRYYVKFRNVK